MKCLSAFEFVESEKRSSERLLFRRVAVVHNETINPILLHNNNVKFGLVWNQKLSRALCVEWLFTLETISLFPREARSTS
jgi:hypothetical protein